MDYFFWPENNLTSDSGWRYVFHEKVLNGLLPLSEILAKAVGRAKSPITSPKSVKINSSLYVMYLVPHLGFQELGLLLHSLILNLDLYSKEMSFSFLFPPLPALPLLFFSFLHALCAFCRGFN